MILCDGSGGPLPPPRPGGPAGSARPCRARAPRRRCAHPEADYRGPGGALYVGDARRVLAELAAASVHAIVMSPPYWSARDYGGAAGQLGHEPTVAAYVAALVELFDIARCVLRPDGTMWVVLGDRYAGYANGGPSVPRSSLLGLPWRWRTR